MRDREFYKSLRGLMIPIAFQSFMLAAVSAGDSAMLGFVDENAMAAVSLAGNIQFVENLFLSAIVCGAVCAGLALLFGFALLHLMTLSDAVRQTLRLMTVISALYMLPLSVNTVVICGIFTAGGDTAFDAYSVAVTMWLLILPAACAAAFWWRWEPMAVYLILSMDEIIKIPWVYAHYKKHRWLRNITREDAA